MTDADFRSLRDEVVAAHPTGLQAGAVWLFAYGSLIWKPACPVAEQQSGLLAGWHRKFCFRINRYRGCDAAPGLMMALDRGGACRGRLQRLPTGQEVDCIEQLLRREFTYKPRSQHVRWASVRTETGRVPALVFVIDRAAPTYEGSLPLEQQAKMIAAACGQVGSCAEYLMNTVGHLEQLGIHDSYLWRLQALVADRIAEHHGLD